MGQVRRDQERSFSYQSPILSDLLNVIAGAVE